MWRLRAIDKTEKIKVLVQEIRDQELEIRQQLRTSTQNASLSIVILALGGSYFATQVNVNTFCVLPIFLNIAALSNLNTAIDVAHQAIVRDWLQEWANTELRAPVFTIGTLAGCRRLAFSGLAVNLMAAVVLVASWVLGVLIALDRPWLWEQVVGTAVLCGLTGLSIYDYATIRRKTSAGLAALAPRF